MNFSLKKPLEPIIYPPQVILASQSIGRKYLLEKLGIGFRIVVTGVDEDAIYDKDPMRTIRLRALAKAQEVVNHPHVYKISQTGETLVIAADSMAVSGSRIFGKAADREDAKRIIGALMGKSHSFMTGICVILLDKGKETKRWEKVEKTKVTLGRMTQPEIENYVNRFDFTRFAAGYALNEAPWDVVTKIEGSYTNVIGLPFEFLLPILRKLKIIT